MGNLEAYARFIRTMLKSISKRDVFVTKYATIDRFGPICLDQRWARSAATLSAAG